MLPENNIAEIHEGVYAYLTTDHPDLIYTLRQKNRGERLDKGYWFRGDENYLAFSFWKGDDWKNKTPNIFFAITAGGNCTLEFVSYDDPRKIGFFEEVAEAIGMTQKTRVRTGDPFEHWIKFYKGNDYLASLDSFLRRDKKIIDAFIISSQVQDLFGPVDADEFVLAKKRIDKERKRIKRDKTSRSEYENTESIYLKYLKISNLSRFAEEQQIEFNDRVTCLLGLNGTGKTSLLKALVWAFTGYEQSESKDQNPFEPSELTKLLRITGVEGNRPTYPAGGGYAEVGYKLTRAAQTSDYQNKTWLRIEAGEPVPSDDPESDFANIIDEHYKSLFLAFPQIQGELKGADFTGKIQNLPHTSDANAMVNNKPDNRFGAFADWLRGLYNKANDAQANKGNANPVEREILHKIFEVVSEVTGEQIRLHSIVVSDTGKGPVWVQLGDNATPILLDLVSQGYSNIFGWIGYFMKRLADMAPAGQSFTQTPAIVLVDEIDTYLHPKWQANILTALVHNFPKVQFVITTHSPYVAGSIPSDQITIYLCERDENRLMTLRPFTDFKPYGANVERLSEELFGVDGRFVEEVRTRVDAFFERIHNGDLQAAKAFYEENLADIDPSDPELQRGKMLIRTKEILAQ